MHTINVIHEFRFYDMNTKMKFIYKENRHYSLVSKYDDKNFLHAKFSKDLILLNTGIKYSIQL